MSLVEDIRAGVEDALLEELARSERTDPISLAERVSAGTVVVPLNAHRRDRIRPCAVGEGLRTKVNANIGTSEAASDVSLELEKLAAAVEAGADSVMDLSTDADLVRTREAVVAECPVVFGTVPVYEAAVRAVDEHGGITSMTPASMLDSVRRQAEEGADFQTIHAGLTREVLETVRSAERVTQIVSRGGAMLTTWMLANDAENPFFERFDDVLEICREHEVTVSLGDALRPGCLADASDAAQIHELVTLGALVKRCREAGVQVMVEGPGHMPLDQIAANVRLEKTVCEGAPFYVLGPIVTDVAPGHDDVTAAIGGALAAWAGADFLCYVTRTEHLCLPDAEDVREGVIVARIAAHAADVAKGVRGAREWDDAMARARREVDWEAQIELALDRPKARMLHDVRGGDDESVCTMCGRYCAVRLMNEYLEPGER
jgi:phosphomethylpyrimidine synthase